MIDFASTEVNTLESFVVKDDEVVVKDVNAVNLASQLNLLSVHVKGNRFESAVTVKGRFKIGGLKFGVQ